MRFPVKENVYHKYHKGNNLRDCARQPGPRNAHSRQAPVPEDQPVVERNIDNAQNNSIHNNKGGPGHPGIQRNYSHPGITEKDAPGAGIQVFQAFRENDFRIDKQPEKVVAAVLHDKKHDHCQRQLEVDHRVERPPHFFQGAFSCPARDHNLPAP